MSCIPPRHFQAAREGRKSTELNYSPCGFRSYSLWNSVELSTCTRELYQSCHLSTTFQSAWMGIWKWTQKQSVRPRTRFGSKAFETLTTGWRELWRSSGAGTERQHLGFVFSPIGCRKLVGHLNRLALCAMLAQILGIHCGSILPFAVLNGIWIPCFQPLG